MFRLFRDILYKINFTYNNENNIVQVVPNSESRNNAFFIETEVVTIKLSSNAILRYPINTSSLKICGMN